MFRSSSKVYRRQLSLLFILLPLTLRTFVPGYIFMQSGWWFLPSVSLVQLITLQVYITKTHHLSTWTWTWSSLANWAFLGMILLQAETMYNQSYPVLQWLINLYIEESNTFLGLSFDASAFEFLYHLIISIWVLSLFPLWIIIAFFARDAINRKMAAKNYNSIDNKPTSNT